MDSTVLTICIPTISTRAGLLSRLLWSIGEQATGWEDTFEVLVYPGDTIPYGDKLNHMFAEACGRFVVAVGDDDWLASDYLRETIAPLMTRDLDYLGYKILYLNNGKYQYDITHTADVVGWPSNRLRGVCQTCPVRTSIARSVPFGNEYFDDRKWSFEVGKQVQKHLFIDRVLYYYDYGESVGTQPAEGWVASDRVGTWDYRFPWWDGPTWLDT
jgi:hypothetical protein